VIRMRVRDHDELDIPGGDAFMAQFGGGVSEWFLPLGGEFPTRSGVDQDHAISFSNQNGLEREG
jgi:hypothetical protein